MLDESHKFLSGWMRVKIKLWLICPNTDLVLTADEAVSECIGSAFFSLWKCAFQLQNSPRGSHPIPTMQSFVGIGCKPLDEIGFCLLVQNWETKFMMIEWHLLHCRMPGSSRIS
jgi:hypothetical protein